MIISIWKASCLIKGKISEMPEGTSCLGMKSSHKETYNIISISALSLRLSIDVFSSLGNLFIGRMIPVENERKQFWPFYWHLNLTRCTDSASIYFIPYQSLQIIHSLESIQFESSLVCQFFLGHVNIFQNPVLKSSLLFLIDIFLLR